jgi:hypothetical protein
MVYVKYTFNECQGRVKFLKYSSVSVTACSGPWPPSNSPSILLYPQLVSSNVVFLGSVMPPSGPCLSFCSWFFYWSLVVKFSHTNLCMIPFLPPPHDVTQPSWSSNLNIIHDIQIFVNVAGYKCSYSLILRPPNGPFRDESTNEFYSKMLPY